MEGLLTGFLVEVDGRRGGKSFLHTVYKNHPHYKKFRLICNHLKVYRKWAS